MRHLLPFDGSFRSAPERATGEWMERIGEHASSREPALAADRAHGGAMHFAGNNQRSDAKLLREPETWRPVSALRLIEHRLYDCLAALPGCGGATAWRR